MPYPAKTNAETILAAAIEYLEQYGEQTLSMRELASHLGITPRALYRYYPDRAALEAAIAEEGFHLMRVALSDAVGARVGKDALRAIAAAYLTFAHEHLAWYAHLMRFHVHTPGLMQAGHAMWDFVVEKVENVVGAERAASAAVALWSFLHGFVQLDSVAIFDEQKPRSGFQVGLEALLSGLTDLATYPHSPA